MMPRLNANKEEKDQKEQKEEVQEEETEDSVLITAKSTLYFERIKENRTVVDIIMLYIHLGYYSIREEVFQKVLGFRAPRSSTYLTDTVLKAYPDVFLKEKKETGVEIRINAVVLRHVQKEEQPYHPFNNFRFYFGFYFRYFHS